MARKNTMKMTQQHYDHLKNAIALIWTQEKHDAQRQFIVNENKAKDVEKRLRWDWSYYAKVSPWAVSYTHLTLPTNREV